MRRRYAVAVLVVLAACTVRGAKSQDSRQESAPTFQSGTNLVLVPVVVRDREGRTVADLGRDSFQVTVSQTTHSIAACGTGYSSRHCTESRKTVAPSTTVGTCIR